MCDLDARLVKALTMIHGTFLQALASTHPNPELLREAFTEQSEKIIANLTASETDDVFLRAVQWHRDQLLKHIPEEGSPR